MSKDVYESPLSSRYASPYMLHLFSADMRFQTWRRLWTALARAEHELGLPITAGQVAELEAHITDIDYAVAEQREREVRHDVMAHVYAYGKAAPSAAGIIHLKNTEILRRGFKRGKSSHRFGAENNSRRVLVFRNAPYALYGFILYKLFNLVHIGSVFGHTYRY